MTTGRRNAADNPQEVALKNFIQPGNTLTLTAPAALAAGDGFLVGSIFAVAAGAAESGADVEGVLVGVFSLPKATGTGSGWSQGTKLYWDPTAAGGAKVTATADTDSVSIGVAAADAADGSATAAVRLNGAVGI